MEFLRRTPSDAQVESVEPPQGERRVGQDPALRHAETFAAIADAIMHRWAAERDTWVSAAEVEQARDYLSSKGIWTTALSDGRFTVEGAVPGVADAAHVVMLGLRHVVHARVCERAP